MKVTSPTFEDPLGDFERMAQALDKEHGLKNLNVGWFTLRDLPNAIRKGGWTITAAIWMDKEIIKVEYIELTVEKDFEKQFMESMQIPHMTDPFPHLEGLVREEILHQR